MSIKHSQTHYCIGNAESCCSSHAPCICNDVNGRPDSRGLYIVSNQSGMRKLPFLQLVNEIFPSVEEHLALTASCLPGMEDALTVRPSWEFANGNK